MSEKAWKLTKIFKLTAQFSVLLQLISKGVFQAEKNFAFATLEVPFHLERETFYAVRPISATADLTHLRLTLVSERAEFGLSDSSGLERSPGSLICSRSKAKTVFVKNI